MATRHSNQHALIPAVAYYRMSSDKQETSIPDQRKAVEQYAAKHGYEILATYQDEAISGDATSRRRGFQAMIAAAQRREFSAVLCWDQDRFGRFDLIEAGRWIEPLREVGVHLATVAQGKIDWDDFSGRMIYGIQQEAKHQFLRDLSRNVSRGLINIAQQGYLCGQAAPYGYDRMIVDEQGQHRQRIPAGEKAAKPRGWRTTLVPSEDPEKLATVRWLFETYGASDIGLRGLADQLNAKGVQGPRKGPWYAASIRAILENRNYVGTYTWAKRREGKYHRVTGGEIQRRDRAEVRLSRAGKPLAKDNPQEAWTVVENAHEAIVDAKVFEQVQTKLTKRKRQQPDGSLPHYPSHTQRADTGYLLSGLVYCGHCGCKMHGTAYTRRKNGKPYRYHKYVCSTYYRMGRCSGCGFHNIEQQQLVNAVVKKLQVEILGGDSTDRLRERVHAMLAEKASPDPSDAETLRKRLRQLDQEIDRAADRLLRAPDDLLDVLAPKVSAMRKQREIVAAELENAERSAQPIDVDTETDRIVKKLWTMAEDLRSIEPATVRGALQRIVDRIDLRFERKQAGERSFYEPIGAEIALKSGTDNYLGPVNRGGSIFTGPNRLRVSAADLARRTA